MKIESEFEIPMVPNFIRIKGGNNKVAGFPIERIPEEELRIIGERWTGELVKKAKERKKLINNK